MRLDLVDMSCGYAGRAVLEHVSFSVGPGDVLCILGPNGVGKTTLFKSMLGLLKPLAGTVCVDGEDIASWDSRRRARTIGYIPQSHVPPFPYTALQVVTMGTVSSLGAFASPGPDDVRTALQAMKGLGILHLRDRVYTEISGGERQMVLIARALAQRPQFLLMDEPTANLDYGNQARVLGQINRLAAQGLTVVMTTHSPDHAFACPSKVALIERGDPGGRDGLDERGCPGEPGGQGGQGGQPCPGRVSFGTAEEMVTEENMRRAYGIDVALVEKVVGTRTVRGVLPLVEGG